MIKDEIETAGYSVQRDAIDPRAVKRLQNDIMNLIAVRLKNRDQHFDENLLECSENINFFITTLAKTDRQSLSDIYESVRLLPSFINLISHDTVIKLAEDALCKTNLYSPFTHARFRIDLKGEQHNLDWHQDYHYVMMSDPSITVWIPISHMTDNMGGLNLIPGSHQKPRKATIKKVNGRTTPVLDISEKELGCKIVAPELNIGDCLVFDQKTLHASGNNEADNDPRISVQIRIGHLSNYVAGGSTLYEHGAKFEAFTLKHPELIY